MSWMCRLARVIVVFTRIFLFALGACGCRSMTCATGSEAEWSAVDVSLSDGRRFARGHLVGEQMIGRWRYWYEDGSPMMIGDFDDKGNPCGYWLVLDRDGALVLAMATWGSRAEGVGVWLPGISSFEWQSIALSDKLRVIKHLPTFGSGWRGTGEYRASEYWGPVPQGVANRLEAELFKQ